MAKKFAYIKLGSHPIKRSIAWELVRNLPHLEIDIMDVGKLLIRKKALVLPNMFFVFKEYGLNILTKTSKRRLEIAKQASS